MFAMMAEHTHTPHRIKFRTNVMLFKIYGNYVSLCLGYFECKKFAAVANYSHFWVNHSTDKNKYIYFFPFGFSARYIREESTVGEKKAPLVTPVFAFPGAW